MLTVITSSTFFQKLNKSYFQAQGLDSTLYDGVWPSKTSTLLVIEPMHIASEWICIADLWQKWLLKEASPVKLLVAGFERVNSPNYLDLLDLPENLTAAIEGASSLAEMNLEAVTGISLSGKFRKFLDGHGEESLLKLITQLRSSFDTAIFMLDDGEDFDEVWDSMLKVVGDMIGKQLVERWEKYKPYFKPTPFYDRLQSYDHAMFERLVDFFTGNPQEETVRELTPQLTELSVYLREIDDLLARTTIGSYS